MDYEIFQNQSFFTLGELEKWIAQKNPSIDVNQIKWDSVEETAIALIQGEKSRILYFSLLDGSKLNYFSYRKVNQAILLIYHPKDHHEFESYYFRLLRRLKIPSKRVSFLAAPDNQIRNELDKLLKLEPFQCQSHSTYQFSFHINHRKDIEDFLNLCRENKIQNLEYANTFPVDIEEEGTIGSFVSKEIFLFTGEIEEKELPDFITGLIESGFDTEKLVYLPVQKVKKK